MRSAHSELQAAVARSRQRTRDRRVVLETLRVTAALLVLAVLVTLVLRAA